MAESGLRVLLYARASSQHQADKGLSVPAQLRELRSYCAKFGHRVVKEFVDDGYSGTTDRRPGFQNMIAYAEENHGRVDAVLVWSFSRFARNRVDAAVYKSRLRKLGIRVVSVTEPVLDGPEGDLLEGIIEAMDSHRSKIQARDVIRGMREVALQGFYPLGMPPIGYRRDPVKVGKATRYRLVPDEETAPIVRRIFQLYALEGKGAKEVAQELNSLGITRPKGHKWNRNIILRIVSNPIYIGTLVVKFDSDNAMWLPPEQREIVIEGFCEPLIEQEIFERAQRQREERARQHPVHLASNYLLSGLVYCPFCGAKRIGVPAKSGQYHYYACATYWNMGSSACKGGLVNQALLDKVVLEKVTQVLLHEENVKKLVAETNRALSEERQELEEERRILSRRLREVRARLDRLLDVIETGEEPPQALWERARERQAEVAELEERLEILDRRLGALGATEIELKEAVRYVTFLRKRLEGYPVSRQRAILQSFIRRIEASKDEIRIEYTLPRPTGRKLNLMELDLVPSMSSPGTPGRI